MIDYFGKCTEEIKLKKLFLIDMDGTIYQENRLFDGVKELLHTIKQNGGRYIFLTNNSSKSVMEYVEKVRNMGIYVEEEDFYISSQATVLYLNKHYPGKKVYCQGTRSLVNVLLEGGIDVVEEVCEDVAVVVVGNDTELTTRKLRNTCELLGRDVGYIATNPDVVCPVSFGYVPDCGSICGMLKNATGREPLYIGKPQSTMIDIVRDKLGYSKEETIIIGDRLYTDIASGLNAGVTTICVLTGDTTLEDILNSDRKPDYTFDNIKCVFEIM